MARPLCFQSKIGTTTKLSLITCVVQTMPRLGINFLKLILFILGGFSPSFAPKIPKFASTSIEVVQLRFVRIFCFRLIIVMKEEERIAQDRIRTYELDPTIGLTMQPRRKTYKNNDAAIRHLVVEFDLLQNPTPDRIVQHLRTLQYRLASNGFDQWEQ